MSADIDKDIWFVVRMSMLLVWNDNLGSSANDSYARSYVEPIARSTVSPFVDVFFLISQLLPNRRPKKPISFVPPLSARVVLFTDLSGERSVCFDSLRPGSISSSILGPNSVTAAGAEGGTNLLSMPPLVKGLIGRLFMSISNSVPPTVTVSFFFKLLLGESSGDGGMA